MSGRVLVYGATGTQGGAVARQLLEAGRQVRVLTRDPGRAADLAERGAEVAVGDLADPVSLRAAHEGVESVALHLPLQYDFGLHEAYGRNAVAAARAAAVRVLVLNTSAHVLDADVAVYRVRQRVVDTLVASGVPHVVVRPTFYLDNLLGPWILPGILHDGVLAFALPSDLPMSWVSSDEVAAYVVAALERPDLLGRVLDVAGPEALTGEALAAGVSEVLGRPVGYLPLTPDQYEQALVPVLGATVASEVAAQVRVITARGDGSVDMEATRALLGVAPVPLRAWARRQSWQVPLALQPG